MSTLFGNLMDDRDLPIGWAWVYLIQFEYFKGGTCYKIGYSADPESRLQRLRSLPGHLQIVHQIQADDEKIIETFWHDEFEEKHIPGSGEWYDLSHHDVETFLQYTRMWFDPKEGLRDVRDVSRVRQYRRELWKAGIISREEINEGIS